jgi:hypothetical protein
MDNMMSKMGKLVETTIRVSLTDSSQLLTAIINTALSKTVDFSLVHAVLITCETYDCRLAFGTAATTTVGHTVYAGQSVRIPSKNLIQSARLINRVVGANSILQITLEG